MRNLVLLLLVVLGGCSKINQPIVLAVIEPTDYTPMMAWLVSLESTPTPVDPDGSTIIVGSVCPTCSGTGKVGDGRTAKTCKDCKGDGRVDEGDPVIGTTELPPSYSILRTYFIEYNGAIFTWDGKEFSSPGREPITITGQFDIRRAKSIRICQGNNYCLMIPIQMK